MEQMTAVKVDTAIHGLMYAADQIDQALLGEKRHMIAQQAERHGPFALALRRVAEVADGAAIENIDAARADVQFCFAQLRHLVGGFYSALWDVVSRAHELVADRITAQEARAILGEQAAQWLNLDAKLGHLHPLELKDDGQFRAYDATFLGEPLNEVRYDRGEIEARKRIYDQMDSRKG